MFTEGQPVEVWNTPEGWVPGKVDYIDEDILMVLVEPPALPRTTLEAIPARDWEILVREL